MNDLKDVVRYCAQTIEDWPEKSDLALAHIGRKIPIDSGFRDEIIEKVEEWCDMKEVSLDFFEDWDEIAEEIVMTGV